jgi:hypothetical protein
MQIHQNRELGLAQLVRSLAVAAPTQVPVLLAAPMFILLPSSTGGYSSSLMNW